MGKLVTLLLLGLGAFAFANNIGIAPSFSFPGFGGTGVTEDGRSVVFTQKNVESRYTSGLAFEEEFMLFGGVKMGSQNSLTHASISGLPSAAARAIASRWPDFTMCRSGGAESAKRSMQSMNFVATTASARDALAEAIDLHEEAILTGGERACLSVKGASLKIDRVELGGEDKTSEIKGFLEQSKLYLVRQASVVTCESVIR